MKILSKVLDKHSSGHITLIAENEEDMWLTYNLIQIGDKLRCSTIRKVQNESATGSVQTKQVRTTLTIEVEKIEFDLQVSHSMFDNCPTGLSKILTSPNSLSTPPPYQGSTLHLKGRNASENNFVKMGAYHTLDLGLDDKFTLEKSDWDSVAIMMVEQAADPTQQADLAAVVMHEGLANLCLLTSSTMIVRAKIETSIPRKRSGLPTSQHEKGMHRFFDQIIQAIERNVNFDVVKCIVLASPGFVKDQLFDYMFDQATRQGKRLLLENKAKFVKLHSSSGHKHALKEVLTSNSPVQARLANTKAINQIKALDNFYQMLKTDQSRAFYGYKHVRTAVDACAVDTLLISDALFRSRNLAERKRYVALVDAVKDDQANVHIFSSLHMSGEQLTQLSGVAAILRFPIAEPESSEDESSDDADITADLSELAINNRSCIDTR